MSHTQRLWGNRVTSQAVWWCNALAACADAAVWHCLAFAQALRARHPMAAGLLRRGVLILWWSVTLQLHRQLPLWLRARRLRHATPPSATLALITAARAEDIAIPSADQPLLSIVIPTYGQTAATLRCLASIAAHPPVVPFELIVVDDAFPGDETACLSQVRGIRLQRNAVNLGFLRSCNAAAATARGSFLLLLNNDTQVMSGWADAMLALFHARGDVGAVGSKLLYPDGYLQEAGGIVWNDGSGWNFGRHDDPDKPIYNYVREVDYCSGASLMLRLAVWHQLGGFDERYAPAYFEDSDLCFRLQAMGLKTLYQPRSVVVHEEGVSHGRDLDIGIKSCQAVNRRTFVARWSDELKRRHFPNGTHVLRARERGRHRPVVLVVDHEVPAPDRDAGSRTMASMIRALLDQGMLVKFWPHNQFYKPGYVEALQEQGVEVLYGPQQPPLLVWLHAFGAELDLVLLSRPEVAEACLSAVRAHSAARIVYYGHDLHFSRLRMQGMLQRDEATLRAADRMEERERTVWRAVDTVLYPSCDEAEAVRSMSPGVAAQAVLPYCFDRFGSERQPPAGRDIVFVAGFAHPPNEDAVRWFAAEVLPRVRASVPNAVLWIAGSHPTERVRRLAGPAIRIAADLSDDELQARYRTARVAVVPLRCGAGVKLKVVEALKEGVPLVTTPIGAQGLPGLADIAGVCSDAESFAAAVSDLLRDDALWQQRSAAQLDYARARFGVAAFQQSLMAGIGVGAMTPPRIPVGSRLPRRSAAAAPDCG